MLTGGRALSAGKRDPGTLLPHHEIERSRRQRHAPHRGIVQKIGNADHPRFARRRDLIEDITQRPSGWAAMRRNLDFSGRKRALRFGRHLFAARTPSSGTAEGWSWALLSTGMSPPVCRPGCEDERRRLAGDVLGDRHREQRHPLRLGEAVEARSVERVGEAHDDGGGQRPRDPRQQRPSCGLVRQSETNAS